MTMYKAQGEFTAASSFDHSLFQPAPRAEPRLAPCVALIGCDGSGKSTLTEDLVALLGGRTPTRNVYLGLGTGDLGRRIGRIPLIGATLERYLTGKAKKAHKKHERLPGLPTALALFAFSLARYRRFRKALGYRRHGIQVITDRYPQAEISGSFDGPGLSPARKGSALVERIASKEQALYRKMASHRPTLVIRLNVDADTALSRKPDHSRALLERKIAVVPTLDFNGARIADVDATRPYPEVRETVLSLLRGCGLYR